MCGPAGTGKRRAVVQRLLQIAPASVAGRRAETFALDGSIDRPVGFELAVAQAKLLLERKVEEHAGDGVDLFDEHRIDAVPGDDQKAGLLTRAANVVDD